MLIDGSTPTPTSNTIYYNTKGNHTSATGFQVLNEVNVGNNTNCTFGNLNGDCVSASLQTLEVHSAPTLDVKIYVDFI